MIEKIKSVLLLIFRFLFSIKTFLILLCISLVLFLTLKYWVYSINFYGVIVYKINFLIFTLIAFLTGLISYFMINYFDKILTAEKQSLYNLIFVIVFFTLLFIPATKINQSNVSDTENRKLAQFVPLVTKKQDKFCINNDFGKHFESWFNDRFLGRDILIKLYKRVFEGLNQNYNGAKVVVNKGDGWFYLKKEVLQTYDLLDEAKLLLMKNNLSRFDEFCKQNNVKPYFVFIAEKSNIYQEYVPFYYLKNKQTIGEVFEKYLSQNSDVKFNHIFVKDQLLNYKNSNYQRLFFSTDNHLTHTGGYILYTAIIEQIQKDFNDVKIQKIDNFLSTKNHYVDFLERIEPSFMLGNLNEAVFQDERYLNYDYVYFYPKDSDLRFEYYDDINLHKNRAYNSKGKYNAFIFGSSFIEQTKLFFASTFEHTYKIRLNNLYEKNFHVSRFLELIKSEKPDILVVIISESELWDYISTMYDETKELEP